ncbi:uncharacterized protein si:ch211-151h10.2 isoform X2 [Syngnathoides biaculeatus]|uniref:uncharacterized protein si:ch211-151h10.2 isoform X2 n=1 Tax=Syngnathoides biaculeatus TaxID=300417 RepID=UPI002ADE595E|nr:uncharacterized protein si:ch211-151h10.2 isoform X2 [Syngnathoides biaculeatus]
MPQLTLGSAGCHGSPGPCARAALVRALDQAPRTGREEEPAQKSSEQPSCDVPKPWTSSHPQMWRKRRRKLFSFTGWSTSSGVPILLGFALVDSLLLSVLQEPLADPSGLHIQDLLSRLESVSNTLERIPPGSESMKLDSVLSDKVTLIRNYLRKRGSLLRRLLLVQAEFESGVKELQDGVERRWGQLEELHTGVTLTREGDQDHTDLASAHHGAETLFADLSHHRNQLDGCQDHLKDSTQLLQELMWSHSSAGNTLRSCNSESVWPELLLQVNMEQFDKVQESFLSLEQQTATFQAHLEGLSRGKDGEHASRASSPDLNTRHSSEVSSERPDSEGEADVRLSLCERSAQQLSSTIGRLRKSGKKNKKVIGD